jgi:dolichyl-diphosphooligosaccharide--protein glycosyltransferase
VELIIHNFLNYAWFEPMSLYPVGQTIYWGPLFPTIAAVLAMALGMTSRAGIIYLSQFIPPLMAVAMVPVMYLIGKKMDGWKTGLLAAFFLAIIPGQYLQRSLYGYFDHHIAEGIHQHLVHPPRAKGALDDFGHSLGGHDVVPLGIPPPRSAAALPEDKDRGSGPCNWY